MKKYIYIALVVVLAIACNPETENNVPTTPRLLYPTDKLLCTDTQLNLQWSVATDQDNDIITYDLEVATDVDFTQVVHEISGTAITQSLTFERGVVYYWRVAATDGLNSSDYSSVFRFYTEGDASQNHLPSGPELVKPLMGAVVNSGIVTLEWVANDVDTTDNLTYDVYFGNSENPIEKVGDNTSSTSMTVNINTSENYYWKVVVKDNNGGETIGQIWSFVTN